MTQIGDSVKIEQPCNQAAFHKRTSVWSIFMQLSSNEVDDMYIADIQYIS